MQARTSQGADADAVRVRVLGAYKEFFALWKDADAGIPILKEARAEFAKLQSGESPVVGAIRASLRAGRARRRPHTSRCPREYRTHTNKAL